MDEAGRRAVAGERLRFMITAVNFAWAVWALVGGVIFLDSGEDIGRGTVFAVFRNFMHGYEFTGLSLIFCGLVSLLATCLHRLQKLAAILCSVWSFAVAGVLQFAAPASGQSTLYVWLLLMCGITCAFRWGLLVLEPYVCE